MEKFTRSTIEEFRKAMREVYAEVDAIKKQEEEEKRIEIAK